MTAALSVRMGSRDEITVFFQKPLDFFGKM